MPVFAEVESRKLGYRLVFMKLIICNNIYRDFYYKIHLLQNLFTTKSIDKYIDSYYPHVKSLFSSVNNGYYIMRCFIVILCSLCIFFFKGT